jgi:uncharacterized cysteine cluster protein YcgN (CxxCxxCC family)
MPPEKSEPPFWQKQDLSQLSRSQWEAICDGCGRCCLQKLENRKTGKVYYTRVACYLLDIDTCRCRNYADRALWVPDCLTLKPENILTMRWLPKSCAYRTLAEGRRLPHWHPLISGDPDSVHHAGISVRGRAVSEECVHPDDIEAYIIDEFSNRKT